MSFVSIRSMSCVHHQRHTNDGKGEYHQLIPMDVSQTFAETTPADHMDNETFAQPEEEDTETETQKSSSYQSLCQRAFPTGFKYETVELLKFSWPVVTTQVLNRTIRIMPTVFTGQLGKLELGGTSMAISIANVAASSLGIGMIAGCETLFSQSYGSSNKRQVGVYLQTAIYMSILLCIVSWGLLLNANSILLVLGQNPVIAKYTEDYLFIFMPAIFFLFMYQLLARYLQVQGMVLPCVFIGLFANACDMLFQYLLVDVGAFGLKGSAAAQLLAYFILANTAMVYIYFSKSYETTWGGWTKAALQDWGQFFRLGLSTVMMISLEWWAFEVSMFLMGYLGSTQLGANSIMYQIWMLYASITLGFGSAIAYRVGRYLGAETPQGAKTVAHVALVLGLILALVTAILTLSLRWQLPHIFSQDKDVVQLAGELLPILALFSFFGATKNACAGIVRGTGKQTYGGIVIMVSYFLFALPVGISLMFLTKISSAGFWWGLNLGLLVASISLVTIVFRLDWNVEVEKALVRAKIVWSSHTRTGDRKRRLSSDNDKDKPEPIRNGHILEDTSSYGSTAPERESGSLITSGHYSNDEIFTPNYWRNLMFMRLNILLICTTVLVIGFLCRFVFFIPPSVASSMFNNTITHINKSIFP